MTSLGYKLMKKGSFTLTKGKVLLSCCSHAVSHASWKTQKWSYKLLKNPTVPALLWCAVWLHSCYHGRVLATCSHHRNQTPDQKQLKGGRIYPGSEFRERVTQAWRQRKQVTSQGQSGNRVGPDAGQMQARCRPDITCEDCSPAPTVSTF